MIALSASESFILRVGCTLVLCGALKSKGQKQELHLGAGKTRGRAAPKDDAGTGNVRLYKALACAQPHHKATVRLLVDGDFFRGARARGALQVSS